MAKEQKIKIAPEDDVALIAKKKKDLLYSFYGNLKDGGEILSLNDIDIAIESLKLAKLDIKIREDRKREEREAELIKQKLAEEEERRRKAEERAAKRAQRAREKKAEEISAMELPLDFVNAYAEDARAHVHCDNIPDGLLYSMSTIPRASKE